MNIEILYIRDLKNILPYKDIRTICDYCKQYGIKIFGEKKRQYVLAVQFKRAQLQEKISHLKEKYGDNWNSVLKSEMNLCSQLQSILDEIKNSNNKDYSLKQKPKPKTKSEQKFLDEVNTLFTGQ